MKRILGSLFLVVIIAIGLYFAVAHAHATTPPPTATSTPAVVHTVADDIATMSLRDKLSALLILHTPGTASSTLIAYVQKYHPGGLILMEDNIPSSVALLRSETDAVQSAAPEKYPFFIATDEEGCTVRRLHSDSYACPEELGTESPSATQEAFAKRAALLQSAGINLNFGIIADITSDQNSFIYPRVFSGDPSIAGARVSAAVAGEKGIVLSTLKHFPGHGEFLADSHTSIPKTELGKNIWARTDAVPFGSGIDAGAEFVMVGHLEYDAVDSKPATLSPIWHDTLKNELGFNGISITDDMIMLQQSHDARYTDALTNAIAALKAGNTMLLYVNDHGGGLSDVDISKLLDGLEAAVKNGTLDESIIDRDLETTLSARAKLH